MPKGSKTRDYEREIEEASNRMRKYPEHLKSARRNDTWYEFLSNIEISQDILDSPSGQSFWDSVQNKILTDDVGKREVRNLRRQEKYSVARSLGFSSKEARRLRDLSNKTFNEIVDDYL